MKYYFTLLIVFSSFFTYSQVSQDSTVKDSVPLKKERKNVRFSILGGPGYTPDFGFLIGGSALFTFSTYVKDTSLKRSVLPIAFAYLTKGGGSVLIRPQLFFNHDRLRLFGQFQLNNNLDNYYGVGYETNFYTERGVNTTEFRSIGYKVNPIVLFRFKDSPLFVGFSIDLSQKNITEPAEGIINDPVYIEQGGDANGLNIFNSGIGFNFNYDTRDIPANAYSGMFLEFSSTQYSTSFGSDNNFNITNLNYRQFKRIKAFGERRAIAWTANLRFSTGDVPITEMSQVGSPFDLRGYYKGQFRDDNAMYGIVEYRHMFNPEPTVTFKKIWSHFGFAAWTGIGAIGPEINDWSKALPNFGAGLRIELQPRMNFRMDVGHDPLNSQTLLYFNMTEAF